MLEHDLSMQQPNMFCIEDRLSGVGRNLTISEKLNLLHDELRQHYPQIERIAVALYDSEIDILKTFACSCEGKNAIEFYQSHLRDSPSLQAIVDSGQPRIINDLTMLNNVNKVHANSIASCGYRSSHTTPIFDDGAFAGFVFLNSFEKDVFSRGVCQGLAPFIHLVGMLTLKAIVPTKMLRASVATVLDISHHRDPETGEHLERMSRFARIIARSIAGDHGLDDAFVEYVYRFSPLHDIGKIAIPDRILLKPARLTEDEYEGMKKHTSKGRVIIERMLNNFRLVDMEHVDILLDIVELHHECLDGTGYPHGLIGEEIPLAARIVSVADVFDALTSERPYKHAWSNADAFAELQKMADIGKLDERCVQALNNSQKQIAEIQSTFIDDPFG